MEKYNEKTKCPKCDGTATTEYTHGVLVRRCIRCGYSWHEAPLDQTSGNNSAFQELIGEKSWLKK
jgi:Zn ribbon nucleic-acid-binding protein